MKFRAISWIVFLLFACANNQKVEQSKNKVEVDEKLNKTIVNDSPSYQLYCFYELNEKYESTEDSASISNWLVSIKNSLSNKEEIKGDLFSLSGGGPLGVEWNPSNDLYFLFVKENNQNDYWKLGVGDTKCEWSSLNETISMIHFTYEEWYSRLKEISQKEFEALFIEKNGNLDLYNENKDYYESIKKSIKILNLETFNQDTALTASFYCSFGE